MAYVQCLLDNRLVFNHAKTILSTHSEMNALRVHRIPSPLIGRTLSVCTLYRTPLSSFRGLCPLRPQVTFVATTYSNSSTLKTSDRCLSFNLSPLTQAYKLILFYITFHAVAKRKQKNSLSSLPPKTFLSFFLLKNKTLIQKIFLTFDFRPGSNGRI